MEFNLPQLFEAGMMICFVISWPLSIIKTIKTKNPKGKSFAFTTYFNMHFIYCFYFE